MLEKLGAELGEMDLTALARNQRCTQALFKPLHFPADRGLGEVELSCSLGEASGRDNRLKHSQRFDVEAHQPSVPDQPNAGNWADSCISYESPDSSA